MRVCIVDDNILNAKYIRDCIILTTEDIHVFVNQYAALNWCIKNIPDVILLDYRMPFMNGHKFLTLLRSFEEVADVPVIIVTAYQDKNILHRTLEYGNIDFIIKPVDRIELISRLKNLHNSRQQRKELAIANNILKSLVNTDFLTQINNRQGFMESFKKELDKVKKTNNIFTFGIFDIDKFKVINDTYGHLGGDEILKFVVNLTKNKLRKSDIFGRCGGEEFSIIFLNTSLENAKIVSERILKEISNTIIEFEGHKITVTISIGLTEYINGDSETSLFSRADTALYRAKNNGRNRIEVM